MMGEGKDALDELRRHVLEQARAELEQHPRASSWQRRAVGLVVAVLGLVAMASFVMGAEATHGDATRFVLAAGFCVGLGAWAFLVVRPEHGRATRWAVFAAVGLALVSIGSAGEGGVARPVWMCVGAVTMLAVPVLLLGAWALRDVWRSASRAVLLGLAAGGVAETVLTLHCGGDSMHVAFSHVLPWAGVVVVTWLLARWLPQRSFVP